MTLPIINNGNPSHHNDDLCRHQIVILLEAVNDAAPCLLVDKTVKEELGKSQSKKRKCSTFFTTLAIKIDCSKIKRILI